MNIYGIYMCIIYIYIYMYIYSHIRTEYGEILCNLFVLSTNAEKYRPEKLRTLTLFTQ